MRCPDWAFQWWGKSIACGRNFSPMTKQEVIKKPSQENPLINILINVLIPVLALSFLSKDPVVQEMLGKEVRPWHVGPLWALVVGLALVLGRIDGEAAFEISQLDESYQMERWGDDSVAVTRVTTPRNIGGIGGGIASGPSTCWTWWDCRIA